MITKKDIQNLAELARLEISDTEAEKLTSELDSILEYVGQTKNAIGDSSAQETREKTVPNLRNVLREDVPTNTAGEYTEKLLNNVPAKEGNYVKVKKIL